jgi:hypothetical protein
MVEKEIIKRHPIIAIRDENPERKALKDRLPKMAQRKNNQSGSLHYRR